MVVDERRRDVFEFPREEEAFRAARVLRRGGAGAPRALLKLRGWPRLAWEVCGVMSLYAAGGRPAAAAGEA